MTGSYTTEDVRMGIAPDIGVRRAATLDRLELWYSCILGRLDDGLLAYEESRCVY